MTHELQEILEAYREAGSAGILTVLATVTDLEGSSYRRPGVRMLIQANGKSFGAVSGGCVEKEVHRQAREVFRTGKALMMTYDGRFRLGCEGILYILIEPFRPSEAGLQALSGAIRNRFPLKLESYYTRDDGAHPGLVSVFLSGADRHYFSETSPGEGLRVFRQELPPRLRLEIIGGEHDAVALTALARNSGWEVGVTVTADEPRDIGNFPGAADFRSVNPEQWIPEEMDHQTGVILMTHSYSKDLRYLLRMVHCRPGYLAILGPANRRERLLGDLLEHHPAVEPEFLESVRGPAGIDIGAETPREIGISILAECLSVIRNTVPIPLKDKPNPIHNG